ncbi:hypothetical protein ABIB85_007494 [Bradyrhizobium sp. JR1.5]
MGIESRRTRRRRPPQYLIADRLLQDRLRDPHHSGIRPRPDAALQRYPTPDGQLRPAESLPRWRKWFAAAASGTGNSDMKSTVPALAATLLAASSPSAIRRIDFCSFDNVASAGAITGAASVRALSSLRLYRLRSRVRSRRRWEKRGASPRHPPSIDWTLKSGASDTSPLVSGSKQLLDLVDSLGDTPPAIPHSSG